MPVRRFENTAIYEYKNKYPFTLVTTRFTKQTWEDNCRYRKATFGNKKGCIYSASKPMSQQIATDSYVVILEMNNETNRLMGIGYVKNRPLYMRHFIYQKEAWNTYSYVGTQRMDRGEMDEHEEQLLQVLDQLCFKG